MRTPILMRFSCRSEVNMKTNTTKNIKVIVATLALFAATPSFATMTSTERVITHHFNGDNDCNNAYFQDPGNKSFDTCKVAIGEFGVDKVYLADVIAKFDTNSSSNPDYTESSKYSAHIDSSDWGFGDGTKLSEDNKSGSWSYTGGYPGIRFWTAKVGNGFNLFWIVDDNDEANAACSPETYTLDCLNLAKTVTTGSWVTPNNKGLSHLTFFWWNNIRMPI